MHREEWRQEKVERHLRAAQLIKFKISYLDDALVGLMPNDLFLIGARTGAGKTELAATLALNFSAQGKEVGLYALEADKWEIQRRLKYRVLRQAYEEHFANMLGLFPRYAEWEAMGFDASWDSMEKQLEDKLHLDTLSTRIIYKEGRYSADDFVRDFEATSEQTDVVIIDHLHYFDMMGTSESEGLKAAVHSIRNSALRRGKPVVLLVHLRKSNRPTSEKMTPALDDIHGHSDIAKVATGILLMSSVAPGILPTPIGSYPTYFHIAKSRRAGEVVNYAGIVGFNAKRNEYVEQYFPAQTSLFFDPKLITDPKSVPRWMIHAIQPTLSSICVNGGQR